MDWLSISKRFDLNSTVLLKSRPSYQLSDIYTPVEILGPDFVIGVGGLEDSESNEVPNKPHYMLLAGLLGLSLPFNNYRLSFGLSLKDYYEKNFSFMHLKRQRLIRSKVEDQYIEKFIGVESVTLYPGIYLQSLHLCRIYGNERFLLVDLGKNGLEAISFDLNRSSENQEYLKAKGFDDWLAMELMGEKNNIGTVSKSKTKFLKDPSSQMKEYILYLLKKLQVLVNKDKQETCYLHICSDLVLASSELDTFFSHLDKLFKESIAVKLEHESIVQVLTNRLSLSNDSMMDIVSVGVVVTQKRWNFIVL